MFTRPPFVPDALKVRAMYHRSSIRAISERGTMANPKRRTEPPGIPPNRLKELREAANITQEDLGRFIGVSHAAVNRWEQRVNAISNRYLVELAKVLRCHPGEIFAPLPDERNMTTTQRKVMKISRTWDEESLRELLETAEFLERRRKAGTPKD
jgi:transcriptional regulator with XRE-family HTH domain